MAMSTPREEAPVARAAHPAVPPGHPQEEEIAPDAAAAGGGPTSSSTGRTTQERLRMSIARNVGKTCRPTTTTTSGVAASAAEAAR